ncbi:amidohydrolase family protein [Mesorhizobium captivum]|uniref:amidohydrolase family protein n=1 Tax=Mesorhizobium captivum TaxID=3072319 RepID=UPI002A24E757|nr:amidohydrolase family protein [Mesorhizobium sp. VK23E]MDX8510724.1 amidohydrolase family protein [Mesorhizobium sp. VK23E]
MDQTVILKNVRPWGETATDVVIREGRIAAVGPAAASIGAESIDGRGAILLPGLVEAHTHLDKTLYGMPWNRNSVPSNLVAKITNERNSKKRIGLDPARQSARQVALSVGHGTTHIRSHVDVDTEHGLAGVHGVMATREKYADVVDIEIVAFPQSGMLIRQGTKELMDEALSLGADIVGGLDPCSMDLDPKGHLDVVFALAEKHGKPIDIHLHEPGELGIFTTRLIIERTRAHAMGGKVTISHAFCLGHNDYLAIGRLLEQLAEAGIAIMTTGPADYACPPLIRTLDAGVTVCSGSDGIRDCWGPYGNADMLERAVFLGMRNDLDRDDDILRAVEVVTTGGATVLGLEGYGVKVGDVADLVLIDGETLTEAVVSRRPRPLVMKRGKVVACDGAPLFTTE